MHIRLSLVAICLFPISVHINFEEPHQKLIFNEVTCTSNFQLNAIQVIVKCIYDYTSKSVLPWTDMLLAIYNYYNIHTYIHTYILRHI